VPNEETTCFIADDHDIIPASRSKKTIGPCHVSGNFLPFKGMSHSLSSQAARFFSFAKGEKRRRRKKEKKVRNKEEKEKKEKRKKRKKKEKKGKRKKPFCKGIPLT
jgi:hypothetical protein